jgi:hypothetical protein
MKIHSSKFKSNVQRGFTLLLATLLASLLSAIGLAIFNIAQKEVVLSSIGRDSQFAFYAADAGAECALYWDFKHDAFDPTIVYTTDTPRCAGTALNEFPTPYEEGSGADNQPSGLGGAGYGNVSSFWFESQGYCAYVSVTKTDSPRRTYIESLGYSTKCSNVTSSRRLERAVRLTY